MDCSVLDPYFKLCVVRMYVCMCDCIHTYVYFRMCELCMYVCVFVLVYSGFLDDEFAIDPIGDTHFNGSQDNGPLSGDHWETELMGAKTTSGMYVCMLHHCVH